MVTSLPLPRLKTLAFDARSFGGREEASDGIADIGEIAAGIQAAQADAIRRSAWVMMVGMTARADWRGP